MEAINIDDFARQLIADKCSALIESEQMLPGTNMAFFKLVRDQYFKEPTAKNYENLKKLIGHTKDFDDSIDYKDFTRRMMLMAVKFTLNKGKEHFRAHRGVIESAIRRLDRINPDLRSSRRPLLQHYNECLENLDSPRKNDEHHLITFAKEIATQIFMETIDVYSHNNKSPLDLERKAAAVSTTNAPEEHFLLSAAIKNKKRKLSVTQPPKARIARALFQL
ncbi:ac106-like protein [Peridroma alphabaculovirus]|uniref:Ac106-like protein n=1 Tax=Peridroma alphabaculovirus TaxID=1346829 RepID=A0A068LRM0_9ABAC|nr:ac106-like protein [Peridroma alphabaculovirus]AIE47825.1 ac106-like protein [Peridroma alphabaculovirus]